MPGFGSVDARVGVKGRGLRRRDAVGRLPPHQGPPARVAAEERTQERGAGAGEAGHHEGGHDRLGRDLGVVPAPPDHPQAVREHPHDLRLERHAPDLVELGFVVERFDEHVETLSVRRGAEVVEPGGGDGRAFQCGNVEARRVHGRKS